MDQSMKKTDTICSQTGVDMSQVGSFQSDKRIQQVFPVVKMNLLNAAGVVCFCRRLISIAFNDMNPFPGRLLRNRRALHLERLQGELRDLEEQQREFVTESFQRKDKELDTMVSEDDEEL